MGDKPLILVVDDETHIVHVVTLKLQNAGYEVVSAEDGEEALRLAIERRPALVVTDYQMPFLSGIELCTRLKEHAVTRQVPAVMLTARGYSLPSEALQATNVVEVFSKPFSPKEILACVQQIVGDGCQELAAG